MSLQDLEGRDVFLWGLGREGWSLLRALERNGIRPRTLKIYCDDPLVAEERNRVTESAPQLPVQFLSPDVLDQTRTLESCLLSSEILVKSPGVSIYRPEIQLAKKQGIELLSTTTLWFRELRKRDRASKVVVVTGTKGKSTTSSLVAHLLRGAGLSVLLGGNIGTPLLDLLERKDLPEYWVLELSSYQVMDARIESDYLILLNLYPEHVDWHGTVEQYYADKLSIIETAKESSTIMLNADSSRLMKLEIPRGKKSIFPDPQSIHQKEGHFFDGDRELFSSSCSKLLGPQNISNVCAALATLKALGLDPKQAGDSISTFSSLPHRLAFVVSKRCVDYINDSISTVPQSALAAYQAFAGRWITSLLGGYERAQDWEELARGVLAAKVDAVITLPDCGMKIAGALEKMRRGSPHFPLLVNAGSLSEAVSEAARITPAQGVVLLSPAAPSYGRFRNFEERGEEFERLVRALPES